MLIDIHKPFVMIMNENGHDLQRSIYNIYIHWVCNIGTAPNANWQHEFEVSNSPLSWTQAKPWMCIDCKAMVLDYHHFQIDIPKLIITIHVKRYTMLGHTPRLIGQING